MGMGKTAVVHARIEPRTKKKAESVLKKLGMSPTEAIRLFYKQNCLRDGLPFAVLIPNEVTRKTLDKSGNGEDVRSFDSLEEMYESWEG
jgi:DNA-damage-inducible protein J